MTIIDTDKIQELIDSDLSAYELAKHVSISRTTILQLRNEEKDIESLTLKNAKKLQDFWEEYNKMSEEKVKNYLENYPKTFSTSMDEMFDLFKSDVYELSKDYKNNEAYVYTVKDLREECEENNDTERLEGLKGHDDSEIVVDTIEGYMYFVK